MKVNRNYRGRERHKHSLMLERPRPGEPRNCGTVVRLHCWTQFIILKFTTMEKAIKKAKLLGNTGMVLVIIGLTGLASISDWQNFCMLVVAVAAVMLVLSNAILTDIHKNIK